MTAYKLAEIIVRIAKEYDNRVIAEIDISELLKLWRDSEERV